MSHLSINNPFAFLTNSMPFFQIGMAIYSAVSSVLSSMSNKMSSIWQRTFSNPISPGPILRPSNSDETTHKGFVATPASINPIPDNASKKPTLPTLNTVIGETIENAYTQRCYETLYGMLENLDMNESQQKELSEFNESMQDCFELLSSLKTDPTLNPAKALLLLTTLFSEFKERAPKNNSEYLKNLKIIHNQMLDLARNLDSTKLKYESQEIQDQDNLPAKKFYEDVRVLGDELATLQSESAPIIDREKPQAAKTNIQPAARAPAKTNIQPENLNKSNDAPKKPTFNAVIWQTIQKNAPKKEHYDKLHDMLKKLKMNESQKTILSESIKMCIEFFHLSKIDPETTIRGLGLIINLFNGFRKMVPKNNPEYLAILKELHKDMKDLVTKLKKPKQECELPGIQEDQLSETLSSFYKDVVFFGNYLGILQYEIAREEPQPTKKPTNKYTNSITNTQINPIIKFSTVEDYQSSFVQKSRKVPVTGTMHNGYKLYEKGVG